MHTNEDLNASSEQNNLSSGELSPTQKQPLITHSDIWSRIVQERLRQASRGFDLDYWATTACVSISILTGGLIMMGQPIPASLTGFGGLGATLYCRRLAKDANDRLDKVAKELKDDS